MRKKINDYWQRLFPFPGAVSCLNEIDFSSKIYASVKHPSHFIKWFQIGFLEYCIDKLPLIQDPCKAKAPSDFASVEDENLTELSCDSTLKSRFGSMELIGI